MFQSGLRDGLLTKYLAEALNKHVGDGSVYIFNDTVEQHYRKEKISKLSPLDRKNIINRKLSIAFPGYPMRAALPLVGTKKKTAKEEAKNKDHLFLFAAVPVSEGYRKVVDALRLADCGIGTFSLLPIESASLVDKIFDQIEKENPQQDKAMWRVLIGQHDGGGLRQIVVKDGQIALTRMTPVALPDGGNGAQWAADVAHEFESTLSYLSRFGFTPQDGLDVALIGGNDTASLVGDMIAVPCNFYPITLARAADLAGIKLGPAAQTHNFANTLHVAWLTKKSKRVLPLPVKDLDVIAKPRQAAFIAMLGLLAVVGYGGYMAADEYIKTSGANKNYEIVQAKQQEAEAIYQDEIKRKESLGIDITLIQSSLTVFDKIDNEYFDPLPLLQAVGAQLQTLKVDAFDISTEFSGSAASIVASAGTAAPGAVNSAAPIGKAIMILKFTFPGDTKPQDGNADMEALAGRLRVVLPDHNIEITKNLADLSFTGALQNITGVIKDTANKVDYTAELTITKDLYAKNSGS